MLKRLYRYRSTPFTLDVWLNRGASSGVFSGQFGIDLYSCRNNPDMLKGKIGEQKAFMSTAHSKWGFVDDGKEAKRDVVYNIFCPKGTKGIYTEPYSAFCFGGRNWNGKDITPLQNEVEVILQSPPDFELSKPSIKMVSGLLIWRLLDNQHFSCQYILFYTTS